MLTKLAPYLGTIKIVALLLALAAAAFAGMKVEGWMRDAEVAGLRYQIAQTRAVQAEAALTDLTSASKTINAAAKKATVDISALERAIEQLAKDFKNAKPLPAGCAPDDFRLRHLGAAVDAVKQAVAGSVPGRAVPDTGRADGQ